MADYDLFLSYHSKDADPVKKIRERLEAKGLKIWFDESDIKSGDDWLRKMREGLDASANFCVCIGANGYGKWQKAEIEDALKIQNKDYRYRIIPLRLPDPNLPHGELPADELSLRLKFKHVLCFDDSVDELPVLDELVEITKGPPDFDSKKTTIVEGDSPPPYRGLEPFREVDAPSFMGRELITASIFVELATLANTPSRFLSLLGASGSGKSSLAKAGLIPRLRDGRAPGSDDWPILQCRCEDRPLEKIVQALFTHQELTNSIVRNDSPVTVLNKIVKDMRSDRETLRKTIELALPMGQFKDGCRVVLLVDQFEELFEASRQRSATDTADESLQNRIRDYDAAIANLLTASQGVGGRTIVVVTLRDDFYSDCVNFKGEMTGEAELENAIRSHHRSIKRMNEEEVRQAIELPALDAKCRFESQLANRILHDFRDQPPGALPLLEHALDQLWQRRNTNVSPAELTHSEYDKMGGLRGALNRHANHVVDQKLTSSELSRAEELVRLNPRSNEHRQAVEDAKDNLKKKCRGVVLHLVRPGDTIQDTTKRRARLSELGDDPTVHEIVDQLSDHRLVTISREPDADAKEQTYVELSHEALIRGWERLRSWVEEFSQQTRVSQELARLTKDWLEHDGSHEYLADGAQLARTEEIVASQDIVIGPDELEFVRKSKSKHDLWKNLWRLATCSLGILLIVLLLLFLQLKEQEGLTSLGFDAALKAVKNVMMEMSENTLLNQPGMQKTQLAVFEKASVYLEPFVKEPQWKNRPELKRHVAFANWGMGKYNEMLGKRQPALAYFEAAQETQNELLESDEDDVELLEELSNTCNEIGSLYLKLGKQKDAITNYKHTQTHRKRMTELAPVRGEFKRKFANANMNLGLTYVTVPLRDRDLVSAIPLLNEAQKIRRALLENGDDEKWQDFEPKNLWVRRDFAKGAYWLGLVYLNQAKQAETQGNQKRRDSKLDEATTQLQEARLYAEETYAADSRDTDIQYLLGGVLSNLGRVTKNLDVLSKAACVFEDMTKKNPDVAIYERAWAMALGTAGEVLYDKKDYRNSVVKRTKKREMLLAILHRSKPLNAKLCLDVSNATRELLKAVYYDGDSDDVPTAFISIMDQYLSDLLSWETDGIVVKTYYLDLSLDCFRLVKDQLDASKPKSAEALCRFILQLVEAKKVKLSTSDCNEIANLFDDVNTTDVIRTLLARLRELCSQEAISE